MSPPDLRLALPALAAWLVAWQGRLVPPGLLCALALVLVVLAALVVLLSTADAAALVAAVLACGAAAGLATAARVHARTTGPLASAAQAGAAVVLEGVLTDDPRAVPPKGDVLAFRPLVAARVRVTGLTVAGRSYRLRQPLLVLSSETSWLGLLPSQHVRVEGRLQDPGHGSDVAGLLSARGPPTVLSGPSLVQRAAGRLRAGLRDATAGLPEDERGLLPGLVDGDTSRLDPALRDDFRTTGLTHLVAVSGTNVAVVLGAALLVCGWLRVGLRWRPPLAGLVLLGFVVLARPSPSVLRATAMGVIALLALATGARRQALPALCAAVLVLVLLSPELAAQPGFALSALATAGLLLVAPVWRDRLRRWLPKGLAEAVAVPAAAQLACTPVVVALSGQLGLLAVPANLLAVPAVAPATVLGVLAALVAPLCLPAAQALAWAAWLPTRWLVLIAHTGARQPGAGLSVASGWAGALTVLCLLIACAAVLRSALLRRAAASVLAGVLLVALALVVVRPGWPPQGWVVVSCDVGQGDGFVVRLGPTEALVIDNGPDPERIDRCLRRLGVRRVPLLVLTHLHADHVEGVPGLLRGRRVGAVQLGPLDEPAVERERLMGWLAARQVPVVRARVGEVREQAGVRWEVLDATARHGTTSDPNNSSIVIRVHTHGVRVLFSGDLETDAQSELLARGLDLRAEVLKVPHHGSAKQDPAFLEAVHAKVALTPVGSGNPYGHPSAQTMRRLEEGGARTYRSDRDGDVAVVARDGRVTTVGRGGEGVAPARASADHHLPVVPAAGTAVQARLGVPDSALTLCDVVVERPTLTAPVPRARSPPYGMPLREVARDELSHGRSGPARPLLRAQPFAVQRCGDRVRRRPVAQQCPYSLGQLGPCSGRSGCRRGRQGRNLDPLTRVHGRGRAGLTPQVPLGGRAACGPHDLCLGPGLDTLGHHPDAHGTPQLRDAPHDGHVLVGLMQLGDEDLVDLELGDRELAQVEKGRVARPEVVERQAHALGPQLPKTLSGSVEVLHHGLLGQLQDEPLGRDARLAEGVEDQVHERALRHVAAGHVHRDGQVRPRAHLLEGRGQDPGGDVAHDRGVGDGREEVVRREEAAFRVLPAQQRLDGGHLAGAQVEDRVVVQQQLLVP
ncbi:MAG TPA: ComEC/Rec2 family competence protein [Mycobacteriales bacterium]|nr:ComEC/Rec2 family competence protein [Mycobacteriales bacterium]